MSRFRGSFVHTIDEKGRLSVPTRFREVIGSREDQRLVITRGSNGCLWVYPMDRWLLVEEDVDRRPAGPAKDMFLRHYIAPSQDLVMDKMGRILIPQGLREEAGLDREVVVAGTLGKFEIWDRTRWEDYLARSQAESLELLKTENIPL
jgi:MraZ protein